MPQRAPSAAVDRADHRGRGRERDSSPGRTRLAHRATSARSAVRSGRSSGASITKQTTPSAGIGQLLTIRNLNRAASSSAIRCLSGAAGLRRVAADIAGIGTKVKRRQAKHHQHFARGRVRLGRRLESARSARRRRGRTAPAGATRAARRRGSSSTGLAPNGSAKRTMGSARSLCDGAPSTAPPALPARMRGSSWARRRSGRRCP